MHRTITAHPAPSYRQLRVPLEGRPSAGRSWLREWARWGNRVPSVALPGAAYAAYVAVTATLLARVVAGSPAIESPGSMVADPPDHSGAFGTPLVLTITVDGPVGPLKLYCDTTTDRVASDQVNVSAAEVVQFYQSVCSHPASEWSDSEWAVMSSSTRST